MVVAVHPDMVAFPENTSRRWSCCNWRRSGRYCYTTTAAQHITCITFMNTSLILIFSNFHDCVYPVFRYIILRLRFSVISGSGVLTVMIIVLKFILNVYFVHVYYTSCGFCHSVIKIAIGCLVYLTDNESCGHIRGHVKSLSTLSHLNALWKTGSHGRTWFPCGAGSQVIIWHQSCPLCSRGEMFTVTPA